MKLQKIIFLSITAVFLSALIIFNYIEEIQVEDIKKVCFKKNCFEVELAITSTQRALGLMNRSSLDQNKAMLFIFPDEGRHGFWMKNTLIALDIIWISKDKKVVYINKNTPPCESASPELQRGEQEPCLSYRPDQSALYVLEINAGLAEKIGLQIGDKISFK